MPAQADDVKARRGVAMKVADQMAWVQRVNALRAMAEEVVLREVVYQ